MKMDSNKRNTYQGFKNWLIANRGQSEERAEVCVSNLRKIDLILSEIDMPMGRKSVPCYSLYKKLLSLSNYIRSEQEIIIESVMQNIGHMFSIINEDERLKEVLGNVAKSKKKDFKSAFILYCDFLGQMTEAFTLEELCEKGYINRERVRASKKQNSEQLSPEFFTKGIVAALRKIGVFKTDLFAAGDKSAIGVPLGQLEEFVDLILKMHGVKNQNNLIGTFSLITASGSGSIMDLCDWLVTKDNIFVDGEKVLSDDVESVYCDPETAVINVTTRSNNSRRVLKLPVLSSRRAINRILSIRIVFLIKMSEQYFYLHHIRECCYEIRRILRDFSESMRYLRGANKANKRYRLNDTIPCINTRRDLVGLDKNFIISQAIDSVDDESLYHVANELTETLRRYSQSYRIELVVE